MATTSRTTSSVLATAVRAAAATAGSRSVLSVVNPCVAAGGARGWSSISGAGKLAGASEAVAVQIAPFSTHASHSGSGSGSNSGHTSSHSGGASVAQDPEPLKKRKALYAGSFDPPSEGHMDIIRRALELCDTLVVAIAYNPDKKTRFTSAERVNMVKKLTSQYGNRVEVVSFTGLVVDFAKANNVSFLVRGLRAYSDFEYEFRMALINRKLTGIETSFLMADERMAYVSSSLIREVAVWGKVLPGYVPDLIREEVFQRLGINSADANKSPSK